MSRVEAVRYMKKSSLRGRSKMRMSSLAEVKPYLCDQQDQMEKNGPRSFATIRRRLAEIKLK